MKDAFAKAESKAVFGTTWQFACRADQVASPGQVQKIAFFYCSLCF
jgi:hypothetical protein